MLTYNNILPTPSNLSLSNHPKNDVMIKTASKTNSFKKLPIKYTIYMLNWQKSWLQLTT